MSNIIVVRPVSGIEQAPVLGSGRVKCNECGCECWVAPTGVKHIKQNPSIKVLCILCAAKFVDENPSTDVKPAPGALAEVAAEIRRRG